MSVNPVSALNATFVKDLPGPLGAVATIAMLYMGGQLADALKPKFSRAVSIGKLILGIGAVAIAMVGVIDAAYDRQLRAAHGKVVAIADKRVQINSDLLRRSSSRERFRFGCARQRSAGRTRR
jgi:hypothetical protein